MKTLLTSVVLAGLAVFAWQQFAPEETVASRGARPAAPVTVVEVSTRNFVDHIPALGTLQAWESIDITSPVSQRVSSLLFEDGDRVEAGQVLATLRQDAELAERSELRARLVDAGREVKRLTDLARKNQVAQTELDSAKTEVEVLEYQLTAVAARLDDRTIVAPFAGVLGLREVSAGALVSTGQRLTTLDDISRMRLQFTVPAKYLSVLVPGMPITATSKAFPGEFRGQLDAVDSRIDQVARAVTARALIPNEDGKLRPGLLMEVEISGAEREVIMVPEESLQSRATRHFVWKLDGEQALRSEVAIGERIPGWVVITDGLTIGDQIVRDGVVRLSGSAMPVRVVQG
ncbi:MAG: efflux RND transporter periplasmic adaptor subunit [Congregibacter sp.]